MNITTFDFNDNMVRVVEQEKEFYFVAKDICDILGYEHITNVLEKLEDDEHLTVKILQSGQSREMRAVTESGLYTLILRSNKPEAKPFRRWVTHEVLPSIRRTGSYSKGFFTEPDEFEQEAVAPKKYYDSEGAEIPDPKDHRYKLPETISPSWIKCIVELYGKRIAENYFATHLGVPQEVLEVPVMTFLNATTEMKQFVAECIEERKGEVITTQAVYEAYLQWGGTKSKNNFGKDIKFAIGKDSKVMNINGQSVRVYEHIALKGV
ncbi:MAG: BRO family protein [Sulfurimonas sp.]|uniref:BRO family protein n=1 Tax=Sulfurimonas sp. TaxID=2022749 RepID=UPI00261346F2|nr:BRO family protein [Sulfurimonas sp.]MDD2651646.1 BRO family protein [Sulfurimonas sp.]MDD3451457.1 BRO family protein [Sulfurimonas sp.]